VKESALDITEVRIKLSDDPSERLRAYCSITLDHCFVIRDLKIIDGSNGPFVAMPSRKLAAHCTRCRTKNHLRAIYCNQCGNKLPADRVIKDDDGRAKLYADIAHPINQACREQIQEKVIAEFALEQERAKEPGYVSRYDDVDYDDEGGNIQRQRTAPPHYTMKAAVETADYPPEKKVIPPGAPQRTPQQPPSVIPAPHHPSTIKPENSLPPSSPGVEGFGEGIF
jgi:stage V sporulation protein G